MPAPTRKTYDKLFAAGRRISTIVGNKSSGERTVDVKSEGVSGDVHENKGAGKSTRDECQEKYLGPRGQKAAV
jgi:hypothetical protein